MIVIIPARLESTRLKNKMLIEIEGKPLIRKVRDDIMDLGYDAYVATDSDEIAKAVKGGLVLRTSQHPNGTLRAMAAAKAIGNIKRSVQSGIEIPLEYHLALERELQSDLFQSEDAKEGIASYVERRTPRFSGK